MYLSKLHLFILFCLISHVSCIKIEEYPDDPRGNFEALWKILDEHYCFFDYKGIDWDSIHTEYSAKINDTMNAEELFNTLDTMLQELRDGHVNLTSPFNVGRYWKWYEDYPANFDADLVSKYLQTDYSISGGISYRIFGDNVGYIYYGNFSSALSEQGLDHILNGMRDCEGIILDVRNNGGGYLSNVETLVSRFVTGRTLVGYIYHKTGKGRNDFSDPYPRHAEPAAQFYPKSVIVLTNRSCYSATNDFVNSMRYCPKVTILGDRTGGGSGLPFSSELPNGWSVRFSACPMLDADMRHIEFGIDPDIHAELRDSDLAADKDTMIELARTMLKTGL